ncbi:MAG: hypothetical protein HETSPECPRED_006368 [Heterodermia speciosa]|uniref:Cyclase n=1 Tax=Heterodermia speciosa TaxID=116794 RepID=A0A8H3FRP3_9LECA|nr:MAG: hypothetical protein HETSPECPRED_006368 [Heterodermia speciosa]
MSSNRIEMTLPFDPDSTVFPSRKDVPRRDDAPEGAAWVWGKDDNLGRLNLLTPTRVKAAAAEIKTGEAISLNNSLPLNVPEVPAFHREKFKHEIKPLVEGLAYDDLYTLNTQSGTQWDGFRHMAHLPTSTFYNNTKGSDITGPASNLKSSIHHWTHGGNICGRGLLLDYFTYAQQHSLPHDPYTSTAIPLSSLRACGHSQNLDIRPSSLGGDVQIGDILFIRTGFTRAYNSTPRPERNALAARPHVFGPEDGQRWGGVEQSSEMLDWLHDCYFAAVAGDAPSFEAWPSGKGWYLHEYLLALWGCPIGELLDLERVSERCRELGRWTFFVVSAPANVEGGVSTHVNGTAIL